MMDDLLKEGKRQLDICNSCRYCEGYCAVFPALERRVDLEKSDMVQLANLCHDCRECYYACMYAPPHEFGVNPPQLFAQIRREHADEISTFTPALGRHERSPFGAGLLFPLCALVVVLAISAATVGLSSLWHSHHGAASPYGVISYPAILTVGIVSFLLGLVLMAIEGRRFWRASGQSLRITLKAFASAFKAAALLENLGGAGEGCAYPTEDGSPTRRIAHTLVAWGFAACLGATIAAAILQDILGKEPAYSWLSVPVILGTVGGAGLVVGSSILWSQKRRVDPAPTDARSTMREYGFLAALLVLGIGGLLTLVTRTTSIYGLVLVCHLATVFACFALAPFTKFSHGLYRTLALVRDAHEVEQEQKLLHA